jgi:hypothetical protein
MERRQEATKVGVQYKSSHHFFLLETLMFKSFLKHKKTDRQATKEETVFDSPHHHIDHTRSLLPANQSYNAMISMSIAIKW